jgi:hypothetical protein
MKKIGNIPAGIQETTQDVLDIRGKSKTAAQADASGLKTGFAFRHASTLTEDVTIASDEACVMAGPVTVDNCVLKVEGTLVIV